MENATDTPIAHRQRTRLVIRLKAIKRIVDRAVAILGEDGDALTEPRRPSAADQVLVIMATPGGMLRTQSQLAAICGIKDRTVAWAMNKLKKAGAVHRREDARWSTTEAHLSFSKLTGEARVDAYLMNELDWRFRNPRLLHDFGRDLHLHPDVGGEVAYTAALNRLVMAGKVKVDAAGKVVKP